jgi:phage terminase large subunit
MSIELIKMKKLKVTKSSVNLIKELRSYKWKKKGDLILDEPVKVLDHAIDALRYAAYSSWRNNEIVMPVIVGIKKTKKSLWR